MAVDKKINTKKNSINAIGLNIKWIKKEKKMRRIKLDREIVLGTFKYLDIYSKIQKNRLHHNH